ncbi:hypothetical protein OG455_06180 [Kitasatospora sp. NBC_01287]|uniref:tetratricopeptide repeat protein n=1 Tax=Kitasatospora sp. NBC_01287 TaxID=2903573 RepID=UPI00225AFBCF|nr:hypothetical protein [Kitasatospora sp. NBC_01287]MCX4745117.1 hypothetical protein [Kitasatospora sp. NBC_01287]
MDHARPHGDDRLAAEGEVAFTRLALDSGELAHAAEHLANALALDPALPEAYQALAELTARCGSPAAALAWFPLERPTIGAAACHAQLLTAEGRWDEALVLLAAILREQPDRPWASVAWLTRPDLPELLDPDAVRQAVAALLGGGLPEPLPKATAEALRPFYRAVRRCTEAATGQPDLLTISSGLARRFGDHHLAVDLARRAHALAPGHASAVMLGYALRGAGRPEEALAVWRARLAEDDSDRSLHVDVAELLTELGRPRDGLRWLESALAAEPDHPQAGPALHGVRYAIDGDGSHLAALVDHLREHPEHGYAATVLARCSEGRAWLGQVSEPGEAVLGPMRHVLAGKAGQVTRSALSALEPASALLTVRRVLPDMELSVLSVPEPDLREPLREVGVRVWRYRGTEALPAVAPPSAAAAELLRGTAAPAWPHLLAAYDHAVALSGLSLADLLGCLAHPPEPADDEDGRRLALRRPDLWIRAAQTFACLGLTHHQADQPWASSDRRRVLADLLFGPEDWVTESAAVALVAVAWTDPAARQDAAELVAQRMRAAVEAARSRVVTVLDSLCRLTLAMPGLEPEVRAPARQALDALAAASAPGRAAAPASGPAGRSALGPAQGPGRWLGQGPARRLGRWLRRRLRRLPHRSGEPS